MMIYVSFRRCIISFSGSSNNPGDRFKFLGRNNDPTSYCGREGIHEGIRDELRGIIDDPQYAAIIKPALETCHEVTCVAHSLGGSLCNLFTMCANQASFDNEEMQGDYDSIVWTKATRQGIFD